MPVEYMNERISQLRHFAHRMEMPSEFCTERAWLMTKAYKENEGAPNAIKRAKALYKIASEMSVIINDGECIVGRLIKPRMGAPLVPEVRQDWYMAEKDSFESRETERIRVWSEEQEAKVNEIVEYWNGRSANDQWMQSGYAEKYMDRLLQVVGPGAGNPRAAFALAHSIPDYKRLMDAGVCGMREKIAFERSTCLLSTGKGTEKDIFLRACDISLQAFTVFAERYADSAAELAGMEKNKDRRAELEMMAEGLRHIGTQPPRTFYEALEMLWLSWIMLLMENYGPGMAFGRIDQYLYPYYKRDIDEGRITKEFAKELVTMFLIKFNELTLPYPTLGYRASGNALNAGFTLAGVKRDGSSGVNELSYIFIEADRSVLLQEELVIRVSDVTEVDFLMKCGDLARLSGGKLKFVCDKIIVPQMLQDGFSSIEDARDYAITGCWNRMIPGRGYSAPGEYINLPMLLELALNNGTARLSGDKLGLETGDARGFDTYDKVWEAFTKQFRYMLDEYVMQAMYLEQSIFNQTLPFTFQSIFYDGCMEKGQNIVSHPDGKGYDHLYLTGIPNIADSFAAIKKVVFEDKKLTMAQLLDALDKNFEGCDDIRAMLLLAPKYGNDDMYVDSIGRDCIDMINRELARYNDSNDSAFGTHHRAGGGSVTNNITAGTLTGATPEGRRAGEPFADGGISPMPGRNTRGLTCTLKSAANLGLINLRGSVINARLSPDAVKGDDKLYKFAMMLKAFNEIGGDLVQFNIISTETLRDAQKHPENYHDLLVRLTTYSAFFIDLEPDVQEEVIHRTIMDNV